MSSQEAPSSKENQSNTAPPAADSKPKKSNTKSSSQSKPKQAHFPFKYPPHPGPYAMPPYPMPVPAKGHPYPPPHGYHFPHYMHHPYAYPPYHAFPPPPAPVGKPAGKAKKKGKSKTATTATEDKKWTKLEEEKLLRLVDEMGETQWEALARHLPLRSARACQQYYTQVVKPQLEAKEWIPEEDDLLVQVVLRQIRHARSSHPSAQAADIDWIQVAASLKCRVSRQCRERWFRMKDKAWTTEEDHFILDFHSRKGVRWVELTQLLPGRTEQDVKQRWDSTMKPHIEQYLAVKMNVHVSQIKPTKSGRYDIVGHVDRICESIRVGPVNAAKPTEFNFASQSFAAWASAWGVPATPSIGVNTPKGKTVNFDKFMDQNPATATKNMFDDSPIAANLGATPAGATKGLTPPMSNLCDTFSSPKLSPTDQKRLTKSLFDESLKTPAAPSRGALVFRIGSDSTMVTDMTNMKIANRVSISPIARRYVSTDANDVDMMPPPTAPRFRNAPKVQSNAVCTTPPPPAATDGEANTPLAVLMKELSSTPSTVATSSFLSDTSMDLSPVPLHSITSPKKTRSGSQLAAPAAKRTK